jgi:transposase InsO family protein
VPLRAILVRVRLLGPLGLLEGGLAPWEVVRPSVEQVCCDNTSLTGRGQHIADICGVFGEASSMAQKAVVVSMESKLAAVFVRAAGARSTVSAVCAELGISRQTYYKYRRRYELEGLDGLVERSRRPRRSPRLTPPGVEDAIVQARKQLDEEGWDNGATSIYYRLLAEGVATPSIRTVHRVLVRMALVVPDPAKRPRSALHRFEFPATDDCWQIDAFAHVLANGAKVVVFQLLDDHSRYEVANLAWPAENGAGAWTTMTTAIDRYGPPRMVLSDNGSAFSGARRGAVADFETNLRALNIRPITSRPYHPQTCGKNERAHRTMRRWLDHQPPAHTLAELQTLLDTYRDNYNNRPHQALHGTTPTDQRRTGTRHPHTTAPPDTPPKRRRTPPQPHPRRSTPHTQVRQAKVSSRGLIHISAVVVAIGTQYCGLTLTAITTGDHLTVFHDDKLIHETTIDRTRHYQTTGRPTGGRRRTRIIDTIN